MTICRRNLDAGEALLVIHLLPLAAARLLVASVGEEISAANLNHHHLNHHNHNHHLHLNHHKDHLHHHNVPPAGASPMHLLCLVGQTVKLERRKSFCFANNYFTEMGRQSLYHQT